MTEVQAEVQNSSSDALRQGELFSDSKIMRSQAQAKPFLRWVGGKSRLLNAILPYVPEKICNYHEPFVGSGAMFFALRNRVQNCFLADLNSQLINIWQVIQSDPEGFYEHLKAYHCRQGKDAYYAIRDENPQGSLERAARFFYLNQTSWNGLWRENKHGIFNVPWGAREFRGIEREALLSVSVALHETSIQECDFRESAERAQKGDLIYFDPPYLPVSDTSKFSGYNGKRFRKPDLEELADICEGLTKKGVNWIVSNRDNEHIREIFSHANIVSFTTRRSVAAQNKRHVQPKDSPEVIVYGGVRR